MLTFSLIAKLLLPKNHIERIDLLFRKLLASRVSFQTVSRSVTQIAAKYPAVQQCWAALLDRSVARPPPLVVQIRELVRWFSSNGLPQLSCIDFVKFLSESRQTRASAIQLFTRILAHEDAVASPHMTRTLLRFAFELLPLLPTSARPPPLTAVDHTTFRSCLGVEEERSEFVMPSRSLGLCAALQRRLRGQAQPRGKVPALKYTPSHSQSFTELEKGGTALVFNSMTKSTAVGHEGGPHVPHHHAEAPPSTRDVNDLLERLETLEHDVDSVITFSEDTRVFTYSVDRAGKCVYGDSIWSQIQPLLTDAGVRRIVIARCRTALGRIEKEHYDGTQYIGQYLETQPINAYWQSIAPPRIGEFFQYRFPAAESESSEYVKGIILDNSVATHKHPNLVWFLQDLLPQMEAVRMLIGPRSLACALWYFALLCDVVEALFAPDAVKAKSWDAALDSASELAFQKFAGDDALPPRKFLSKVFKSIITNRAVVDEIADEIVKHFGSFASHFAHFYPVYTQLNRAASAARADPHLASLLSLGRLFGRREEYHRMYLRAVQFPSRQAMFEMTFRDGKLTVSRLRNYVE
jgi:hypothetical protein